MTWSPRCSLKGCYEMKHTVKLNEIPQKMEFKLGSGILDCNNHEIFEGHHVKVYGHVNPNASAHEVIYHDGALFVGNIPLSTYSQPDHCAPTLEIMD